MATKGLMGIPEYREMAENFEAAEERYNDLAAVVTLFVDVESVAGEALERGDYNAADVLRAALDDATPRDRTGYRSTSGLDTPSPHAV